MWFHFHAHDHADVTAVAPNSRKWADDANDGKRKSVVPDPLEIVTTRGPESRCLLIQNAYEPQTLLRLTTLAILPMCDCAKLRLDLHRRHARNLDRVALISGTNSNVSLLGDNSLEATY